jgi:hypothetical protein
MLWVLNSLATSVAASGMTHFLLSHGVGQYFPKLAAWAKTVGATETAAYATAATVELKRLNGGKLPPKADAPRIEAIQRLEHEDEAAGGRALFFALDEEYRGLVVTEIPARLRAYVREHQTEVETALMEAVDAARRSR